MAVLMLYNVKDVQVTFVKEFVSAVDKVVTLDIIVLVQKFPEFSRRGKTILIR